MIARCCCPPLNMFLPCATCISTLGKYARKSKVIAQYPFPQVHSEFIILRINHKSQANKNMTKSNFQVDVPIGVLIIPGECTCSEYREPETET